MALLFKHVEGPPSSSNITQQLGAVRNGEDCATILHSFVIIRIHLNTATIHFNKLKLKYSTLVTAETSLQFCAVLRSFAQFCAVLTGAQQFCTVRTSTNMTLKLGAVPTSLSSFVATLKHQSAVLTS